MKKKLLAMAGATILSLGMAIATFAAPVSNGYGYGCGMYGSGYGMMWDADGNFRDKASFEENLNNLIKDGQIREEDRDFYMERYDWCSVNGGQGGCGGGMGRGRRW